VRVIVRAIVRLIVSVTVLLIVSVIVSFIVSVIVSVIVRVALLSRVLVDARTRQVVRLNDVATTSFHSREALRRSICCFVIPVFMRLSWCRRGTSDRQADGAESSSQRNFDTPFQFGTSQDAICQFTYL